MTSNYFVMRQAENGVTIRSRRFSLSKNYPSTPISGIIKEMGVQLYGFSVKSWGREKTASGIQD
ncbi:MAG: hypothetical protein LUG47_04885, partial [Clostridiales bacterium]|nr:hypothetical protein [Clostridiales bacterium]